jgi:hypothetical protein
VVVGRVQAGLIPNVGERREIHNWWGGLQRNGDLMLLLAHLLTRNPEWRNASVIIRSIASNEHMRDTTVAYLERFLPEIRFEAEIDVRILAKGETIRSVITRESGEADVVFLGLDPPEDPDAMDAYAERLKELASGLRTVLFVKNATLFVGELIETASAEAEAQEAGTKEASAEEAPAEAHPSHAREKS